VCLQEVDLSNSLAEITSTLAAHGFTAVVQDRKGFNVVNATFFQARKLRLVWTQHRSRALLVGLTLPNGRELSIANVHLEAGSEMQNESQRRAQLKSVLKRVRGNIVVCGDFNSCMSEDSQLRLQLADAGLVRAPTKGITYATSGYADVLDHIWSSQHMVAHLVLGSSRDALTAIAADGIPNVTHPSDHLPVAATFAFRSASPQTPEHHILLEVPSVPSEEMRQEWLQICWHASLSRGKMALREQRRIETAFLDLVTDEEAAYLRQWRDVASAAARNSVSLVVDAAVAALANSTTIGDGTPKPFDPGTAALSATMFGGA